MTTTQSPVETCADCGKALGTLPQETMFNVPKKCLDCLTAARIKLMLIACPNSDDALSWKALTAWERQFLTSVRVQFAHKGELTAKQFAQLERIYEKV